MTNSTAESDQKLAIYLTSIKLISCSPLLFLQQVPPVIKGITLILANALQPTLMHDCIIQGLQVKSPEPRQPVVGTKQSRRQIAQAQAQGSRCTCSKAASWSCCCCSVDSKRPSRHRSARSRLVINSTALHTTTHSFDVKIRCCGHDSCCTFWQWGHQ